LRNSLDKSSGEIPELLKKSATADSFSLPQNPGECVISAIFTHGVAWGCQRTVAWQELI
jgi:hypothetical protein